ncbi:hypothetical protein Cgig2_009491 [Carnegiea gigantea]|uniref:tRNA ligase phosphodiesterase domain-containing protein n=1 Tax=Carnegiea gigantea TaxID=171969 RepID=A0A9Q1GUX3_9CARY|nr:hypothetical protein Cgig2_009491 [Carnegiea gigantea]
MGAGCQESGDHATAVTPEKGGRVANRAANRSSRKVMAAVAADSDVGGCPGGGARNQRRHATVAGCGWAAAITARGGSVTVNKAGEEEEFAVLFIFWTSFLKLESTKGSYAKEWEKWEKQMRETLLSNSEYLNSIQVPFESAVNSVLEQLRAIAKGDYTAPSTEKKRLGAIVYACISLPVSKIHAIIDDFARSNPEIEAFFKDKNLTDQLQKAHVTLAHKRGHGVTAVANYGQFLNREVPVELTALLFSAKLAAFEARLGSVDGEKINSKNEWPHVTLWTAQGIPPKEANNLPQLVAQGNASRVEINPPVTVAGRVEFF